MSSQVIKVLSPVQVATPRGAEWAARATLALLNAGRAIWRALEESGRGRAANELRQLANHWESTDPQLAARLRATIATPAAVEEATQ